MAVGAGGVGVAPAWAFGAGVARTTVPVGSGAPWAAACSPLAGVALSRPAELGDLEDREIAPTATRMPISPLVAEMSAAMVVITPGTVAQKDFRSLTGQRKGT